LTLNFYIPILITPFESGEEDYKPYFSKDEYFKILKILWKFLQSAKQMTAHHHKFDADFLMQLTGGVLPDRPVHSDSQTARHLYNTKAVKFGLDDDLLFMPKMTGYDFKRKQEVKDDVSYTAETVTVETTGNYCDGDVQLTNVLETFYVGKLNRQQQLLYREVMHRAIRCYAFAKHRGVLVDKEYAENGIKRLEAEYKDKEKDFLATYGFKPSQNIKLSEYLFEELKLEPVKKTKGGGNSADKDVLEVLAEKYIDDKDVSSFLKKVEEIQFPTSVIKNSLQPYLKHLSKDGRIHADLNIAGTATLRRSCSKPNLQNMPKRNADKVWVRGILIPSSPGSSFMERDLSAVEMFVLGFMAGDKPLMDALERNISPHAVSASSAFNIPIDTFDKKKYKDQYAKGKELNFANVFGAGFETLYYRVNRFSDEEFHVTREELHKVLNNWREKHFAIVEYKQRELNRINRQGYVDTPFGHRRYVDMGKGNANTLFNTIMQSSSGLMILLSIVLAFEEIEKQNALDEFPFCFDIHDAEIFEFPRQYQDQLEELTRVKTIEAANYMGMPTIGSEVDIYPERFGFKGD